MDAQAQQQEMRPVEISGWDTDENFFVEKVFLQSCADGHKRANLRSHLRIGSLVFLRAPEDISPDRSVPIAYEVSRVSESASNGSMEVELIRRHPRKYLGDLHEERPLTALQIN